MITSGRIAFESVGSDFADVVAIWDVLGVEKSHWVGLSIGGMIGYGLGIEHAIRIDGKVVMHAPGVAPGIDAGEPIGALAMS